jgi:hypothetical protein
VTEHAVIVVGFRCRSIFASGFAMAMVPHWRNRFVSYRRVASWESCELLYITDRSAGGREGYACRRGLSSCCQAAATG